jgi:hypothetical protein
MATRQEDIEAALADPPQVHFGAPAGVWATDRSCYEFIAKALPGEHVAVVKSATEVNPFREYLTERGLPEVAFEIGWSDEVLPRLSGPDLDFVLVDGGHGFPVPIVDWFYAASRLREGGVVVLDDLQLPQVRLGLHEFLSADPRWECIEATPKWGAYRRLSAGHLREEWREQPFLGEPIGS